MQPRCEAATKISSCSAGCFTETYQEACFFHYHLHPAGLAASAKCLPARLLQACGLQTRRLPTSFLARVSVWLRQPVWRRLWISNRVWAHPVVCGRLSTDWLTGEMTTSLCSGSFSSVVGGWKWWGWFKQSWLSALGVPRCCCCCSTCTGTDPVILL